MNAPVKPPKTIDTLVEDIYALFSSSQSKQPQLVDDQRILQFGQRLGRTIVRRLYEQREDRANLRLSNLGTACSRKLWYSTRTGVDGRDGGDHPQGTGARGESSPGSGALGADGESSPEIVEAEELSPANRIKFLFGDILEELLLFLAEEAGHTVTGRQDEIDIDGVKGHRDAVIDGRLVDVKSASTLSFRKFKEHRLGEDDPFGYVDQLGAYLAGSQDDPLVTEKDVASFLVIDKTLGNICLDTYPKSEVDYIMKVRETREMLSQKTPPPRSFEDRPEGKSGNRSLAVQCSYCQFKQTCWPQVRTFLYANGPAYLTKVVNTPKVPEVDKDGKIVERF